MKFEVSNRWTGDVQFTAEIDCHKDASNSIKLGLAVKWAYENDAAPIVTGKLLLLQISFSLFPLLFK